MKRKNRSRALTVLAASALLFLVTHGGKTVEAGPSQRTKTTVKRTFLQVAVDVDEAVDQNVYSAKACGPASVLNALAFGNDSFRKAYRKIEGKRAKDKLAALIEGWGKVESDDYTTGERWRPKSGVSPHDLTCLFNDLLETEGGGSVTGRFLDRTPGEDPAKFVERIHASFRTSLARGVPVIVNLRSFAPGRTGKNDSIVWNGVASHFVLLYKIPETLEREERGFVFEYLDPNGPVLGTGYIYFEGSRNFTAAKGNSERWKWLKNRPFLLVNVPTLNTLDVQEQDWYWRTIVTLNHAIGALD